MHESRWNYRKNPGTRILIIFAVFALAIPLAANAEECPKPRTEPWAPTDSELLKIRADHEAWIAAKGQIGCRAELQYADIAGRNLLRADLRGANLLQARLTETVLVYAKLQEAVVFLPKEGRTSWVGTVLRRAELVRANLSNADLEAADLSQAFLLETTLDAARLSRSNLTGAFFGPASVTGLLGMESAQGLSTLRFEPTEFGGAGGLALMRDDFRKRALHAEARQLTYAIRRQLRSTAAKEQPLEAMFNYFAFELTCGYGLYQGRPLRLLGVFIVAFALLYMVALLYPSARGAIWRVWVPDRIAKQHGQAEPEQLSAAAPQPGRATQCGIYSVIRLLALSLYMSILSAFHIGWRDLNVGSWIARMQPREYTVRTTGWVRLASGLQSLISVYLIALWVLTYFGKPFD